MGRLGRDFKSRMFPLEVPLGKDVDFRFLAKQFSVAGSDIRNVALDAAFLAARDGRIVTMKQHTKAMARQMVNEAGADSFADGYQAVPSADRARRVKDAQAMAEKTKSLEMAPGKTPEASSPSRPLAPSVSPSGFSLAAIQGAAGNMSIQRAARAEGGEDAPVRSESALHFLSVPHFLEFLDTHKPETPRARQSRRVPQHGPRARRERGDLITPEHADMMREDATQKAHAPDRVPGLEEEAGERYDRDAAGERSREVLRAAMPGLDADGHAEFNNKRQMGRPLPYLSEMERAFGRPLGDVEAHTGMSAALAPLGAHALAVGNTVAFADEQPAPTLVAHEATHVIQNQNAGDTAPMAAGLVAPRESAAEVEADGVMSLVESQGLGTLLPAIAASPAAHVQLSPDPRTPVVRVDKTADGEELRAAILAVDKKKILAVLERNANPEYMYALCRAVGPGVAHRLELILDGNDWARARAYLGEQVSLDRQIATHDKDAIFRDLHRVSDQRALDLFSNAPSRAVLVLPPLPDPMTGPVTPATHAPAPTTLAEVQEALRSKLSADDYFKAMRLLLEKADRALVAMQARGGVAPGGPDLGGFTVDINDIVIEPADPTGGLIVLMVGGGLDPVSEQRVQLAEERIRAADANSNDGQAFLGLADLDVDERKALALRLKDKPLTRNWELAELATQADDATVIHQTILRAHYAAWLNGQATKGINLDVAVRRAGDLVRKARARLDQLPPDASEEERKKVQEEVQRLERLFFADSPESLWIRGTLQTATDGDPKAYAEQLHVLGADPVTIGRELLRSTPTDIDALITTLKLIPAEHRIAAMRAADRLGDVSLPWPADKRELLDAYLQQGIVADPSLPLIVLSQSMLGPSPEATIALHDVLDGMDRGPNAAHVVLARLERLNEEDHRSVVSDPRFEAKLVSLPTSDIWEKDFKAALTSAKGGVRETTLAIQEYPGPAGPSQNVTLEAIRIKTENIGQAEMRRAYVLSENLRLDPSLRDRLSPQDDRLLKDFSGLEALKPRFDTDAQRASADEIMLGQPQLTDTPEATLDPNNEAAFMYIRLRKAAKIPDGKSLTEWSHSRPEVMEALAAFDALYTEARPAGVGRGHLAQLAEIYFRAMRAIDEWNVALAENEGLAKLAAMVAGVVVAVVVTAATGGVLGPVAVAVLAGISAGTASAVAGAAVRWEDTPGTVLTDFGSGAVEGIASVAGAGLAAKVVRGASAGLSAGKAAVQVGGKAARVGGNIAAKVAESAIDGAVGGAAGELFQTAVDEATWDRGIAEGLASMLAAIARGGAIGAVVGGVVGGVIGGLGRLAARAGDDVAQGVGHLADSSGVRQAIEKLDDPAQDELAKAYQLVESGQLDEAEKVIHGIDGMPHKARAMLIEAARARAVLRTSGGIEAVEARRRILVAAGCRREGVPEDRRGRACGRGAHHRERQAADRHAQGSPAVGDPGGGDPPPPVAHRHHDAAKDGRAERGEAGRLEQAGPQAEACPARR